MAINNDRNLLEQQILSNSGLKGKELENLRARLATLSEQQLQAELSKSLSGNNKGEWYTGVMLEHNESVIMRYNHDQTSYTDDNGNEITELKDGDEVLERTIKSTDDKGNVFETTVTFSGGRPLTQTKTKNGNTTETTTYKYNDDADVPFVTVETKKADQSKVMTNVLEIDENGNFDNEDFIDRKTTLLDGTETFVTKENGRLTENVKKIGKPEVTTVYNGDNIQNLDSKKLNRLKQNDVYYDGKGNTYVQINAGETAQIMADRINKKRAVGSQIVTAQQIIELNPNLVKKNGEFVLQKFENGVKGLGEVRIPGEFDANSPFIKTRQSVQKANNLAIRAEVDRQVAKKVTESTNKKFVAELANNGFKPTRENAVFYKKFNALNPTQQQNVLSVIKYCKNQKITDPNKIKARILETFPEINLFDSGKTIPQTNNNVPLFQRKNPVALETFLTETLKLDLKSETGAMVYEKLASLPQEHLNKINAQNFSDLSKANFVEIAHRLEANGIDIRSRQEHQIENNSPRMKAEQEKRELRESASKNIALAYDNAINIIKQYQGNQGWINVGFYREKLGKLLSNINPTKINTCFDDVIKELEKEKKFAVGYLKGKSTNDKEFKEAFKKISGGVEYNEANMKAFLDVAQDQSANFEDEKYNEKFWNAYNKAFGVAKTDKNGKVYYEPQVVKQATSRTNFQQYADGAGDIVLMLLGTEAIGKGVAWAGGKLISKVSPYVPKFLANAGSKTVMTIGSNNITVGRVAANMASQSASFTLWDASKNYINLKTKDIQYSGEAAEKEWEAYKEGNVESAKFGAFAGALNTTVVGKVINGTMKMFEKPIAKAVSKVGKSFEKTSAMSGSDVMKTFMLNQTPGVLAKTAGTIAEIGGFTLYETANEVIEELLKKGEGGHLPAKLTEDGLTSYLLDKLGDQAKNLGEIKAISRLIFMHKGAIQEQARLMDENLTKCETLKNVQIKKTEINGREIFEVTLPDGSRKVANSVEEVIANCNVLMQLDMISNAAKENETVDKKTTPQGMNAEEDALIQKARKENPATIVEEKVRRQWQQHDIETTAPDAKVDLFNLDPNAGLKEPVQNVENEVTSLIFKGKLNKTLTQRYDEMGRVFTEIAKKHSADIEQLAKQNPKDKQAVADGIVKILAQELEMEGFEPPIVFADTSVKLEDGTTAKTDGGADWPNGRIVVNKDITNVKKLTSIISHEFVHMLQYRDILAQYGEQGLRDLIANDKSIPENEKEQHIQKALNNPYNQHLLQSYDFQKAQTGTVNDYLRRIYKDEFTNTVGTEDMPRYVDQASERGAYSSQEKVDRGLDESNLGELAIGEIGLSNAELVQQRLAKMRKSIGGNKVNQDTSVESLSNETSIPKEVVEIDEFGQIHRKEVPAGISTMSDAEFASKGNTSKIISEQSILDSTQRDILAKEICQIIDKNNKNKHGLFKENDILEYLENFGFDKEKCNTFKTLLEVKVKALKENSSDREYEFLSLDNAYDLIDIYDTGDKLKACIALLENGVRLNIEGFKILENTCSQNRFYRPERKVAPWSVRIDCTLNEFIEKTAEYLNTVKGNESLEHNIMPDIILQKNSTEIISDALKENSNITFEELIQKFNENNILKLNKVKDSEMKRLALELLGANRFITEDTMQIIMDICNKPQDLLENNRTVDIINNLKKSIKNGDHIKLKDELKNISSYTDKIALDTNISMSDIKTQLTQIGVFDHIVDELSQKYGNNETVPTDIINFANEFFNLGKIKFGKEYNRDIKDGYIDPEKYITAEKNRTLRSILEITTDKSGKPNINELNKIMDYLTEHIGKLYVDDLYSFLTYGKNKNGEIDLESVQKVKNAINPNKITYGIGYDFFSSVSSLRHHLKTGNNAFLNDSYDYESYNKLLDSVEKPWDVEQMNSILASIGENIEAKKTFINNPRPTIEFISELRSKGLVRYRDNESDIEGLNLPITEIQIKALDFIKKAKITRDDRKELFDILNNLTKSDLLLLEAFFDKYDDGKLSLIIEHIAEFREYDKKSQDAFIKALKNDVFSTYERYDKNKCINFKKSLVKANDATRKLLDVGVTKLCWENVPDFFNGNANGNYIKLSKKQSEFALRLFEICQEEGNSLSTQDEINNLIANAHPDTYECIENYLKAQKPGKKYYRTVLETVNKVYSENKNAIQEYQDFIKENPEYKDELGIKAGLTALDKFKILAKDKELLNSLFADKDYYISEILTDYDYVTSASIEKSMQNLPELTLEAKTKFPHALGRLFLASLSNKSSKNMADIYNIISKYDKDVALRLENILSTFGLPNNMITYTSNIDYLVDCIKNEPTRGRQLSKQFINNVAFLTRDIKEIENIIDKAGFPRFKFEELMETINIENVDNAISMLKNYKEIENPDVIIELLRNEEGITYKQVQHLIRAIGKDKFNKLNSNDLIIACKFISLHGKSNINEIPIADKKDLLHSLVSSNTSLFKISDDLSKDFPLIPKNQEEYCSLLPSIVRSLGIETNELTPEQRITMFNSSMGELSKSLAEISDADFAKMTVTQEYPKDKFILDVLDKVKSLPRTERQKVYDYFGFELHHNKENSTGFSITGYPVNLNNGKKLAQIEDPRTKAVVEDLRPNVIRFSENNKIKCNNPQVERFLNEVIEALPELRTTIGKKQHGAQAFDVMQHSLKVMQKVAQDPKFETLNESDQKIMLLASLMHDITKSEGRVDKTHANEGSFDTYFIAQKFNLTKEEEVKLHTLIKNHEWLEYVNTAKSEDQLTKRLQSVAYDLHQGNLFDMAEIFTHADLKAVKIDDSFHDTTEGNSRISFDGTVRSFGKSANVYAERIRGYIKELQKSQPLLPQTKIPRANKINEAITQVNPDGSTNIKGVYKDKDGLIVIKFNEVEDWEAIGFPKGSISHGIEIQKGEKGDAELSEDVNTGNIKFFVHGLDYSNQLAKFDAFSLVDSDALLSVSYAERPESKFRFFRPQGVLLDVNSKYIHGGGNTDAGSGCGKDIAEFKNNYIFGGYRESDRLYISDLIKKATGMTDEQYVEFVETNKDRPIQEIEPVEIREKIIKAFATINSNTRKGKREYNEMYISNPNEVMGVFAYSMDYNETIGNPVNFLNRSSIGKYEKGYGAVGDISVRERTEFLRQYALERNLPFIIFGD